VISLLNQLSFCPPDNVQRHWMVKDSSPGVPGMAIVIHFSGCVEHIYGCDVIRANCIVRSPWTMER